VNTFVNRLITTFHHVVSEQSGNDVTVARAKTMIALASLTWPRIGIAVTPQFITPRRMIWQSAAFDAVAMGGSFRRDPVGDDASIIIDDDEPKELVMLDEMRACASFIPLFGRQRLERFNITLAELFPYRENGTPLPLPGSGHFHRFHCEDEYRRLHAWLIDNGAISPDGEWQVA
jgi:hypothetical protein